MTQIAQMPFASRTNPAEHGAVVLHDDGTVQIVPSDAMRDDLSRQEEAALHRAHVFGTILGLGLVAAGLLAVGAGWLAGRIFGKLGYSLTRPRPVGAVSLTRTESGGVTLTLRGASRLHVLQMTWSADEVMDADAFLAEYDAVRGAAKETGQEAGQEAGQETGQEAGQETGQETRG